MITRRSFLRNSLGVSAAAFLPLSTRMLFRESMNDPQAIIESVEVIRVHGTIARTPGQHRQHQIKPEHLYPGERPPTYMEMNDESVRQDAITHDYLSIATKGGVEGLYGYLDPEIIAPLIKQLRSFLIGRNALAVENLWEIMYRRNRHSRAGHYMMALSAVDNALWDLKARYFGVPVYELLGGPTRDEARVYGSCLGYTVEKGKAGPKAKELYDNGFHHQKWFMAYGPGDGNAGLRHSIELVQELREAVGDDGQIMFDAFMGWDLPFATAWAKEVEQFRPYWIEEAFSPNRLESFSALSKSTSIPVATGEHFYNRWEVLNFLKAGAIQIVQADPEWCGGVSELIKICNLASSFGAKVIPHGHNIHAALHVVLSQSREVCPLVEYLINHVGYKLHFQKDAPLTTNGIIPLPTKPGFGIELDEEKVERREVITSL